MSKENHYAEYTFNKESILKDGHTMFNEDIVKDLNRKSYLENKINEKPLTIEELRKKFISGFSYMDYRADLKGRFKDERTQLQWEGYRDCARDNNIIKE